MRKIKSLISLFPIAIAPAIASPLITSCAENTDCTVQFYDGTKLLFTKTVQKNTVLADPGEPEKPSENLIFIGWYEDADFRFIHSFDKPITQNLTLYVKWIDEKQVLEFKTQDEGKTWYTDRKENGDANTEYYVVGANYATVTDNITLSYVSQAIEPEKQAPTPPYFLEETKLYINREACAFKSKFITHKSVLSFNKNATAQIGSEIIVVFKSDTNFNCRIKLTLS